MHPSAMELGRLLFQVHGTGLRRVLDVGSLDINGSLRELCPAGVEFIGIDLEAGKGVDIVLDDPYRYPFPAGHFDMIVSTSCFAHEPMFWLTFLAMLRVVRTGGIIYINAPSNGHYHHYQTHPLDNWRFYPDASQALEQWGRRLGQSVCALESFTMTRCGPWNDYVMLFAKGTVDPAQVRFLSEHVPGVINLRKVTHPGEVLFRRAETDDLVHMDQLHARIAQLEAQLAQAEKTRPRAAAAPTTAPPLTEIGIVDAEQLVSGAEPGGLIEAIPIVAAGHTRRRQPVFVDSRAVPPELRGQLEAMFAQEHSIHGSLHLLTLADPLVVGQGSVLVEAGGRYRLLRDSAREFLAHGLTPDGLESHGDDRFALRRPIARTIEQPCLLLKRPWYGNYGHWLVDQAMALSYLVHIGALPCRDIVVGAVTSPDLRSAMQQTLAAILPDAVVHEHPDAEIWLFRQLQYVMPLHVPPLFKLPAALDFLRADLLAVPVMQVARPRRLYVARRGEMRSLVNEDEIIALSAEYGFEAVCPETLSMAEQAVLFNQAEAILGVKGAALANILFANADCRVMLMSPGSFIDPFYWDIARVRGLAYGEVFGEVTTDRPSLGLNDFRLEPADVAAMLRTVLATAGPAEPAC